MMRATLESTSDGILVTDKCGKVTGFNEKYVEMWRMPREMVEPGARATEETASRPLQRPGAFIARIREIEECGLPESFDILEFTDGRVFEALFEAAMSRTGASAASGAFVMSPNAGKQT
jgi:PAS domain-containing protein